jgi:hypothetical protein
MRTVRLGRAFDAVFIHDAVMYISSEKELRAALATVAAHLGPGGGVALVAPDATAEAFREANEHGSGEARTGVGRATSTGPHTTLPLTNPKPRPPGRLALPRRVRARHRCYPLTVPAVRPLIM